MATIFPVNFDKAGFLHLNGAKLFEIHTNTLFTIKRNFLA